jgi:hypothetical protein
MFEFIVSDTGIGIPKATETIFEVYSSCPETTRKWRYWTWAFHCKKLLELQNGSISLKAILKFTLYFTIPYQKHTVMS